MRRLFTQLAPNMDNTIRITDKQDIGYISVVLRMKIGDDMFLSDGVGKAYEARIAAIEKNEIVFRILTEIPFEEKQKTRITLYQGLPKGAKMDEVVRKSTELGVFRIVPVATARTVPEVKGGMPAAKLARWRRIAGEASRQSRRARIPEVGDAVSFAAAAESLGGEGYDLIFVLYELEEGLTLKRALREGRDRLLKTGPEWFPNIAVFIGPEGGFEREEVDRLLLAGAQSVTVGETIMRTETAGPAAIAMVLYEVEL